MKIQQFKRFAAPRVVQPSRLQLVIPTFTLAPSTWRGVSRLRALYAIGNDYNFSLKAPVDAFGANFVATVRYSVGNTSFRWKLWDHEDAVLYYPVYAGEVIGAEAFIEIWSVNSAEALELEEAQTLLSSVLAFPNNCSNCCSEPFAEQILAGLATDICPDYGFCQPFCNT